MSNEFQNIGNEESGVYVMDLLLELKKHIVLLILVSLLGGAAAFGVTKYVMQPIYQSQTTIYVYNNQTREEQLTTSLAADLIIIAKDQNLLETVAGELKLDRTYKSLRDQISVSNPQDSHMLTITVKDADPQLASDLCNCLCEHLQKKIAEILNTDLPAKLSDARPAETPISPSLKKNVILGMGGCFLLAVLVILLAYFMNGTIQSEEDISRYLGLYTLAVIPEYTDWKKRYHKTETKMKKRD